MQSGSKRTFFEQQVHHRVDGGRRPKSRPLPSALRGTEALLAGVEVGGLQHSRVSPTLEPGLRTQHRSGEARSKRDGQKASSCEQPVGVARVGESAPLVARSGRSEALSSDHHAQESVFDPLRTFLSGSQNSGPRAWDSPPRLSPACASGPARSLAAPRGPRLSPYHRPKMSRQTLEEDDDDLAPRRCPNSGQRAASPRRTAALSRYVLAVDLQRHACRHHRRCHRRHRHTPGATNPTQRSGHRHSPDRAQPKL